MSAKTKRKRIPRAAVLWTETLELLRAMKRKGKYVFISTHGTRFNRNTRGNDFRDLRKAAGVSDEIKFSHIRDGAYTAASNAENVGPLARVLAGHHADGYQDNYVLRNPKCAAPACEAVYLAYFGKSLKETKAA